MPLTKLSYKKHKKRKRTSHDYDAADSIDHSEPGDTEKKKHKRHKAHRSKHKHAAYDPPTISDDLEDGWVPPSHSMKPDESEWNERLFEAMMDDEGQDFHSSQFNSYWQPTPDDSGRRSNVNMMTDEEYRQYIVNGIYERTHADEIKAEKARQEKRKRDKEKKEKEQARMRAEEAKRDREREATRKIRLLQKIGALRKQYQEQWKSFEEATTSTKKLHLKDIPWPFTGSELTKDAVKDFLLHDIPESADQKKAIRKELLRYHPDKFMQRVSSRIVDNEKERESIEERINHLSSCLNDIWSEL
jgi:hypothetical protein